MKKCLYYLCINELGSKYRNTIRKDFIEKINMGIFSIVSIFVIDLLTNFFQQGKRYNVSG